MFVLANNDTLVLYMISGMTLHSTNYVHQFCSIQESGFAVGNFLLLSCQTHPWDPLMFAWNSVDSGFLRCLPL